MGNKKGVAYYPRICRIRSAPSGRSISRRICHQRALTPWNGHTVSARDRRQSWELRKRAMSLAIRSAASRFASPTKCSAAACRIRSSRRWSAATVRQCRSPGPGRSPNAASSPSASPAMTRCTASEHAAASGPGASARTRLRARKSGGAIVMDYRALSSASLKPPGISRAKSSYEAMTTP